MKEEAPGATPGGASIAAELSRRDFLQHATVLGAGALVVSALPVAERMLRADPAIAAVRFDDATLQAFADTILPGRRVARTDLGEEIHPQAIAGVETEPGAVQNDVLRLYKHRLIGFDALVPAFLADLSTRSAREGNPSFLNLPFDRRVRVVLSALSFDNPDRVLYEAAAAVPFVAFCAGGDQPRATSRTASGYRVMGHPGRAPNGYTDFSYRRRLARGRTRRGSLP